MSFKTQLLSAFLQLFATHAKRTKKMPYLVKFEQIFYTIGQITPNHQTSSVRSSIKNFWSERATIATWVFGLNAPDLTNSILLNKKWKISKNGRNFFLDQILKIEAYALANMLKNIGKE